MLQSIIHVHVGDGGNVVTNVLGGHPCSWPLLKQHVCYRGGYSVIFIVTLRTDVFILVVALSKKT